MTAHKTRTATSQRTEKGFALVVAMCLLVLLLLLAVGLMSLSAISLRGSSRGAVVQQARSNARLALQIAIGSLQAQAGPDQRVTAPSTQRGSQARAGLTGVWEGWKWNGEGSTPNWDKEKSDRFKGWLVSSTHPEEAEEENYAEGDLKGDRIKLVGESPAGDKAVEAALVNLGNDQRYAWAVFDESQKVSVSVDAAKQETFADALDRSGAAANYGYAAVKAADWSVLGDEDAAHGKLLSTGQIRLAGVKKEDVNFHDLTTSSRGVLSNVAAGGLAGDLSRLFDRSTLPADFATKFIYSGTETPLVGQPARFTGANPLPSPDPAWSLLHSHYRAFTKLSGGDSPYLDAAVNSVTARPSGTTSGQLLRHKAFTEQQVAPVIAKAQFVFSLAFGYNADTMNNMWNEGSAIKTPQESRDEFITWLVIDPVITLWNPYNVPLRFSGARVELYRIPLAFRLYKNGKLLNTEYTKLTNAHTAADFKTREARFYRLNILPEEGSNERVLAPGEHVVFTAHNHKMHGGHDYNLTGVTLRPGFNPPAGNDSPLDIGGVTTQNIFVNSTGASSGKDHGKTIRTVAVKPGDQIQIEVKSERAGIDNFKETGGKEITGFLKYYLGGANVTRLLGGIELDYGDREEELLPHYAPDDLPTIVVSPDIPKGSTDGLNPARHALRFKEPFLISTFQAKTERDSRFPSRSWIDNAPANLYASGGIDQAEDFQHHQFEFKWEAMTDWPPNSPTIEISNTDNRGYGGPGIYAQSGVELATFASLPLAPAHSLAQFRHAPLNVGGQLPLTSQIVGNSFEPPLLGEGAVRANAGNRVYLDHSYLANNALFDNYYLSSASDHPALAGSAARKAKDLLKDFYTADKKLPNSRYLPYPGGQDGATLADRLESSDEGYKEISAHLLIDGPFNVNSTRVAAWQALLASNFGGAAPQIENGTLKAHEGDGVPVLRHSHAVAGAYESGGSGGPDHEKWNGYRRLDEDQIEKLAQEIVEEVKERGPFQSLAEFVNRRPGDGDHAEKGALEAAIERAGLNAPVLDPAHTLADGNTADGAPAVLNQADILTPLAPLLTARGDTFRIRAYGEASEDGKEKIRVWAEATVQRLPEYLDSRDSAEKTAEQPVNQRFGRRFEVVSFRWLKASEV